MEVADIHACIAKLSDVFGTEVTLSQVTVGDPHDLPSDDDEEVKPIAPVHRSSSEHNQALQSKSDPKKVESDAPVKFQLHDVGPRPCTDGAFDQKYQMGEPTDKDMEFCSWKIVKDYPDHFIGKTNRPHVKPFFDNIFEDRVWDFFYLFDLTSMKDKPFFLVPTSQFQIFLDSINKQLGIALSIPAGVNADRFLMKFGQDETPRPRYIGRSENKPFNLDEWPLPNMDDVEAFRTATAIAQEDFRVKIKKMKMAPVKDRNLKSKAKSARKKADREHMLAEVQYLLGLKGWEAVPEMVFVSFDVEALERPPNPVSEVGLAILDARDMAKVSPGSVGQGWWDMAKCHHLRVGEYSALRNHEFIQGCPDNFDFGESTFPPQAELPAAILGILQPYLDAGREIALIGHDTQQDIQYLSKIGLEIADLKRVTRVVDTQSVHQVWRDLDNGRGLQGVLNDLGIACQHLHNAGNDAVYTLRALVGIAIEDLRKKAFEEKGEKYEPIGWQVTAE